MTAITDKLAEALRALVSTTFITDDEELAIDQERGLVAVEDASIALAAYDAQPEHQVYTLAEIRNGTGFPSGARFVMLED